MKFIIGEIIIITDDSKKIMEKGGAVKILDPKAILCFDNQNWKCQTAKELAQRYDKEYPNKDNWNWE